MADSSNAILGTPPTLEWIDIDRLQIDPVYQRVTEGVQSKRIIKSMVHSWDWRLCLPLSISRRDDGALLVVDGQHRLFGARDRGDIPHLPCVVSSHANAAEEARTFVALNQQRQKLSQGDIFRASLASGDVEAKATLRLIEKTGLSLAPHSNWTAWKPLQIFCAPAITKARLQYGDGVVGKALAVLAKAYCDEPLRFAGTLLPALYPVFQGRAKMAGFDQDQFAEAIASVDQQGWLDEASVIRVQNQCSRREALITAFIIEYDALCAADKGIAA